MNAIEFRQRTARLATLATVKREILPNFLSESDLPTDETLRAWFSGVPQFKSNPAAKRGGGSVLYSVSGIEKYFRSRMVAAN